MNFLVPSGDWPPVGTLYVFLPLAFAGFITFAILAAHSLAQFFTDRSGDSK